MRDSKISFLFKPLTLLSFLNLVSQGKMKEIIFTRQNFDELRNLKYLYTCLSIRLTQLKESIPDITLFADNFRYKLKSNLQTYDTLCSKMYETSLDVKYFTGTLAELGFKCLKSFDEIGEYFDTEFQNHTVLKSKFNDCWFDHLFYW